MVNVTMPHPEYLDFRAWLRQTDIVWRDMTSAVKIPAWQEIVISQDYVIQGKSHAEIAFKCLKSHYPKADLRWTKDEIRVLDLRCPRLFLGKYEGEIFHLDVISTYCSLYSRLCLGEKGQYPLNPIASELRELKGPRNAVVGICRSLKDKWCQGMEVWYRNKQNRYLSPELWKHLTLILSDIALRAEDLGAIWINTDGYCFRDERSMLELKRIIEDAGLKTRTHQGEGKVLGLHTILVPGKDDPKEISFSKPTRHIETVDKNWLDWWSKLS